MPKILLLTSAAGDGPVSGDVGDVLELDADVADVWCDGVRAEPYTNSADQRRLRKSVGLPQVARKAPADA